MNLFFFSTKKVKRVAVSNKVEITEGQIDELIEAAEEEHRRAQERNENR